MHLTTRQKLIIATLLSRGLRTLRAMVGYSSEADVTRRGVRWRLDLKEGIDLALYLGVYENQTIEAIRRQLNPDWVVLDIGANVGAHTLPMADRVGPNGRVIAFEPTGYAFGKLRRNLSLNPELELRVTCLQALLVAETLAHAATGGASAIHSSWPLTDTADVHPLHRGRQMSIEGSSVVTLDDCVRELGLSRVDFIKLDVDGNEWSVLAGARLTLARFRPIMIMEFAPYVHDQDDRQSYTALLSLLQSFGYAAETKLDGLSVALSREGVATQCVEGGGVDLILRPVT